MAYKVKLTDYAVEQLREINRYIAQSLLSPDVASQWMQHIKKELASLDSLPNRYPLAEEEPWHTEGIRKMIVKNFLVYYWVEEEKKTVWVTAVVYGRRDQTLELRKMPVGITNTNYLLFIFLMCSIQPTLDSSLFCNL